MVDDLPGEILLRLHYMIGAFDTKNIHYSVSFY